MRFPKPNNIVAEKYVAGMSLFKSKLAKIKLSANESALGPSPKARKKYLEVSSEGRTMVDRSSRTCSTRGEMKIKSQKCFYILFPSFCVPPTAILPSVIIIPIMAAQKRSGAAPSKPNTGPTGPIFACARAQDPRHA